MKIVLLHNTPLTVCVKAIRTCWDSHNRSDNGDKDKELIYKVGNKNKHSSTLEHLNYTFDIKGISRACLQELARHRITSLSVKSTRYTLRELKVCPNIADNPNLVAEYCVLTEDKQVNKKIEEALIKLQELVVSGIPNDVLKFALPEAYKTELVWTINARSLQNFLALRTSNSAMWEIRKLANNIYAALPEDHKYLFTDFINN